MKTKSKEHGGTKLMYLTTSKHYNTKYKVVYPYYKPIVRLIDHEKLSFNKNTETV